jgi:hypothetical protein
VNDDAAGRIERIEAAIRGLSIEVAELKAGRAQSAAPVTPVVRTAPAALEPPAPPLSVTPSPPKPATRAIFRGGIEAFVGRYGALALAALSIVMGAGALVSWALRSGLLGPTMRVVLGAILAAALAALGWYVRSRGARRFGHTLLALALAVTHVVAWGAGPKLDLIPGWAALAGAAAASIALAALALSERSEPLFTAGFGGALVAPFVMSNGTGDRALLAGYGAIVLSAGIRGVGGRAWKSAIAVLLASAGLYAVAVIGYTSRMPWFNRELPVLFAATIVIVALIIGSRPLRPWLSLGAAEVMALAATSHRGLTTSGTAFESIVRAADVPLAALAGTALLFVAVKTLEDDRETFLFWLVLALVVPTQFLDSALAVLGTAGRHGGAVAGGLTLLWATAFATASLAEQGRRRGVLLAASGLTSTWAIVTVLSSRGEAIAPALAVHALLFAWVARRESQPVTFVASAASVLVAFVVAIGIIESRTGYTNLPFLSTASLGAACAVAASYVAVQVARPLVEPLTGGRLRAAQVGALVASILAFVWGRFELAHAFSRDASTFLSITYHAACGVLAIRVGRTAGEKRLRQAGLALCVFAALMAVLGAWDVEQIVLRVGSYLAAGGFLLGVAWWYRRDD